MDNLVKLYIDYRIKKKLPELSKDEIFAIDDFDAWQEKHAAQQNVRPTCFTCGYSLRATGYCTNQYCAGPFTAGG